MKIFSRQFNIAAKNLFNTHNGLIVLAHYKKLYMEASVIDPDNPYMTYYKAGQEDFIKSLLDFTTDDQLDNIEIKHDNMEIDE